PELLQITHNSQVLHQLRLPRMDPPPTSAAPPDDSPPSPSILPPATGTLEMIEGHTAGHDNPSSSEPTTIGHSNSNCRRAQSSKTTWVPKVPLKADGVAEPTHKDKEPTEPVAQPATFDDIPATVDDLLGTVDDLPEYHITTLATFSCTTNFAMAIQPQHHTLEDGCNELDDHSSSENSHKRTPGVRSAHASTSLPTEQDMPIADMEGFKP
ncbi:hypothetical protein Dimus_010725, partial [Dionaea muscipula]